MSFGSTASSFVDCGTQTRESLYVNIATLMLPGYSYRASDIAKQGVLADKSKSIHNDVLYMAFLWSFGDGRGFDTYCLRIWSAL